jgi:hypothetical protein
MLLVGTRAYPLFRMCSIARSIAFRNSSEESRNWTPMPGFLPIFSACAWDTRCTMTAFASTGASCLGGAG